MCKFWWLVVILLCKLTDSNPMEDEEIPLLLVISYDGLRADFLNEIRMPNLWRLAKQGVHAPKGIKPQVITVTAPNYFSIATGLYQENHGIVGNEFYDPDLRQIYDYWNEDDQELAMKAREAKWYKGTPIWQLNQDSGRFSGGMRWPLCDARVNNKEISKRYPWEDYGELADWNQDMDILLRWFTHKENPINLGFFYISEPDHTQHENDIYSTNVRNKLASLDAFIVHTQRKLRSLNLYDRMNILFVSDHGHVNVHGNQSWINLDDFLNPKDYVWSGKSLFPNPLRRDVRAQDLYKKLNNARMAAPRFDLWWKSDVPDKYRYKNNKRIGPIVLIEHAGYSFWPAKHPIYGTHGYSNEYAEMRPAFFAIGPAFERNLTIDWEMENIDLYNLMAAVLKLEPAPNDGNFSRVYPLLKESFLKVEPEQVSSTSAGRTVKVQLFIAMIIGWVMYL